jgi:hypothetical protein
MKRTIISALMLLTVPTFPCAEPAPNMINGTIGDLEISVPIWSEQSDFYGDGNSGGVSILTRPVAPDQGYGTLSIGFEGSEFSSEGLFSLEVNVADIDANNTSSYFADRDSGLQIHVTRSEYMDGTLSISGEIQGDPDLAPIDANRGTERGSVAPASGGLGIQCNLGKPVMTELAFAA